LFASNLSTQYVNTIYLMLNYFVWRVLIISRNHLNWLKNTLILLLMQRLFSTWH